MNLQTQVQEEQEQEQEQVQVQEEQEQEQTQEKKKQRKKKKTKTQEKFRIAAKRLFLTYSQVPEEMTAHDVYLQLQNILNIQQYVIAREKHKDGGIHYHAVLVLVKKCNIRSPKTLDLKFHDKQFHGNYAPVKSINQSITYVCKDKEYITNFKNIKDGKILSIPEEIIQVFKENGQQYAMNYYYDNYPEHAFGNKGFVNANRFFKSITQLQQAVPSIPETPFDVNNFAIPPKVLRWLENNGQPTLILIGPAGCGKTALVKSIAKYLKWKTLTITNLDGLRDLTPEYDLLFMDDISGLDKVHPQRLLALLETNDSRNIRVIYENVKKHANLKQIIALNESAIAAIKDKLMETQMLRRFVIAKIDKPIMINLQVENLNIFNAHTHIHNNPECIEENRQILDEIETPTNSWDESRSFGKSYY